MMIMMNYWMTFLIKKHLFKVFFFIYYHGDYMKIEYGVIQDKSRIIDIRTSLEYDKFNIPGSINVPKFNLLKNPDYYMNEDDDYYLLCNKGEVSYSCCKILNALGYKCYSIIGGIELIKKHNI